MTESNLFNKPEIAKEWVKTLDYEHEQKEPMDRKKIIYPYILDWVKENNVSGNIVDIGSGEGFLSSQMPENIRYIGIEPSEALVEIAHKRYKSESRQFIIGTAYNTGLEDQNTSAIVSVMVWFHLKDLENSAKEVYRNLKPGGKFLIISSNPLARQRWEGFYEDLKVEGKTLAGKINTPGFPLTESEIHIHTNEEVVSSLENAGLIVEKVEAIGSPIEEDQKLFVAISGGKQ
jgi:SAM-dependent methyltransferase